MVSISSTSKIADKARNEASALASARSPQLAIVTALPIEYAAFESLLDNVEPIYVPGKGAGRRYAVGQIPSVASGGVHHVVLSLLPDMGNNTAAARAALILEHFPEVGCVFMVGIAGGVPFPEKSEEHVRLGDIVVSDRGGVVQYDNVKSTFDAVEHRHPPRSPDSLFLEAVRYLSVQEIKGQRPWLSGIARACKALKQKRPPEASDVLISSKDGGQVVFHPDDPNRRNRRPRVFHGRIASANNLLKNPAQRDALREKFGVRAIEMEGSGIADATWICDAGFMVVRGISDYCDDNKNKVWQPYAAITAAAYAKALIESVPAPTLDPTLEAVASGSDHAVSPEPEVPADNIYRPPKAMATKELSGCGDNALSLLGACPRGLPETVLARAAGCSVKELEKALAINISAAEVLVKDAQWSGASSLSCNPCANRLLAAALESLLDYVENHHRSSLGRRQIPTVVEIARQCRSSHPELVSKVFNSINSHLKRIGDKDLVWEVAELSIEAARQVPGTRSIEVVQGETVALVCGRCWVLQREGEVAMARVYAEQSLRLGQTLPWPRNDAFCKKCLGRIYRLEAAETNDKEQQRQLFQLSEASLKEAIACFHALSDADREDEIGDCYSLLGRTHLEAGDRSSANDAIWEAAKLLTDQANKDFLDLQILIGDFYVRANDWEAAEAYYSTVINQTFEEDQEKSDMRARALLKRSWVRWKQGIKVLAQQDIKEAETMWNGLHDFRGVAEAQWAWYSIDGKVPTSIMNALRNEPMLVRATAVKTYLEQIAGSPSEVVARRSNPTTNEIGRLIREARQRVAREVPLRA